MRDLAREFARRAEAADFPAVIDTSGEYSAREVLARARELADALGPSRPTVLAQADNSWRTVVSALAVGLADGVLAVVNRHTTGVEFAAAVEDIAPDIVIAEPAALAEWSVAESRPGAEQSVLDGWGARSATVPQGMARWRGGAFIGLTSGSTGRAKGVVQSEAALRYACARTIEINGLRPGDPIGAIVPLSSTAAFCFGVYLALSLGSPLVLPGRWEPAGALRRLAKTDVRWTMCVPTMVLQLAAVAEGPVLDRVSAITVGGGPMDATALRRAETALGTRILRVFGMSECLGHTSPRPDDPPEIRLGRDGRPFPGTEVRAVTETGVVLPIGATGHAQVRGPSLFLGYARGGAVAPAELTADGFLPTGDLVRTHADGTITVMGRAKDVIIRGGRNIDITEIERAVASCPRVAQACVAPVPDEVLGERIALLVVSEDGAPVELAAITAHLDDLGLSKAKWPEFVFLVAELPQTKVGKLDRAGARNLASRLHAVAAPRA